MYHVRSSVLLPISAWVFDFVHDSRWRLQLQERVEHPSMLQLIIAAMSSAGICQGEMHCDLIVAQSTVASSEFRAFKARAALLHQKVRNLI